METKGKCTVINSFDLSMRAFLRFLIMRCLAQASLARPARPSTGFWEEPRS
jgi:hypothetical protein